SGIDSLWEFDISADGRYVAGIAHTKKALSAHLWDTATGKALPLHTEKGYMQPPRFSPDGTRVVAIVDDAPMCWNAASGSVIWTGERTRLVDPTALCFTPDGKYILARSSSTDSSPIWWNAETGKLELAGIKAVRNVTANEVSGSPKGHIDFGPLR